MFSFHSPADALTKHLAVEWGPDNVRVVGVAPGPIKGTPGFDKLGESLLPKSFICMVFIVYGISGYNMYAMTDIPV